MSRRTAQSEMKAQVQQLNRMEKEVLQKLKAFKLAHSPSPKKSFFKKKTPRKTKAILEFMKKIDVMQKQLQRQSGQLMTSHMLSAQDMTPTREQQTKQPHRGYHIGPGTTF